MDVEQLIMHAKAHLNALKGGQKPIAPKAEERQTAKPKPKAGRQEPALSGIEAVTASKNRAFGRMHRLHAQLRWMPDSQSRLDAALEILALEREVQRHWKRIDAFHATGILPEEVGREEAEAFDPSAFSPAELMRMRGSAKAYLSKAKAKGYPEEKINERKALIEAIDGYLNAIHTEGRQE